MNISNAIATALECVVGVWAVWWGIVSICAPTRIRDKKDSLMHKCMVWSIKRSIFKQRAQQPLTISLIRFLGITYLVGGILFLTDAIVRSFF